MRYVATLRKALKLLREDGLTLLHDRSKVHTSKMTTIFLQKEKVKSKVITGNRPTRTIKQLKREVMKAWRELGDEYMGKLCNSMPSRVREVIQQRGYLTKY